MVDYKGQGLSNLLITYAWPNKKENYINYTTTNAINGFVQIIVIFNIFYIISFLTGYKINNKTYYSRIQCICK